MRRGWLLIKDMWRPQIRQGHGGEGEGGGGNPEGGGGGERGEGGGRLKVSSKGPWTLPTTPQGDRWKACTKAEESEAPALRKECHVSGGSEGEGASARA